MNAGFPSLDHDHKRCVADALARADEACDARGVRLTPLRRRVLQALAESHSPLGAYDEKADRFLILDVARYKYPPVWVTAEASLALARRALPLRPVPRRAIGRRSGVNRPLAMATGSAPSRRDGRTRRRHRP